MTDRIVAKCGCGAFEFKTDGQPILQLVCHCADCRSATGNDYSTIVFFDKADYEVAGDDELVGFTSDLGNNTLRRACAKCGDVMIDESTGFPTLIGVMAERILPPFTANPKIHVWTQSKLEHVKLPKNVKIFEKGIS